MNCIIKKTQKRIGRSKNTKKVQRGGAPKIGKIISKVSDKVRGIFRRTKSIKTVPPEGLSGVPLKVNPLYESATKLLSRKRTNSLPSLPQHVVETLSGMKRQGHWASTKDVLEFSNKIKFTLNELHNSKMLSQLQENLNQIQSDELMETYNRNNGTTGKRLRHYDDQSNETKKKLRNIAKAIGQNITPEAVNNLFAFGKTNLLSQITARLNLPAHVYEIPTAPAPAPAPAGTRTGIYFNIRPTPHPTPEGSTYFEVANDVGRSNYLRITRERPKNAGYMNVRQPNVAANAGYMNVNPLGNTYMKILT